ncbi:GxxExxY protein [Patescibacteria group bacterium]|nr:GxxExxY protein [Patescibacteria group bacterium]
MQLHTPVKLLNRVGSTLEKRLKHLGIETAQDLLFYFPFRYEDYSQLRQIKDLKDGEQVTVKGKVELIANKRSPRKRTMITEAVVADETEQIKVVWFGQPFITKTLRQGDTVFLSGKVSSDMFGMQMVGPAYEKDTRIQDIPTVVGTSPAGSANKSQIPNSKHLETTHTARIVPMYSLTTGITQKQLRFLMSQVIDLSDELEDWLPEDLKEKADMMNLDEAIRAIHFPESDEEMKHALRRLKFDELFILQLRGEMIRQQLKKSTAPEIKFKEKEIKEFVKSLPFELTKKQKISAWEILQDMEKAEPMNRLLEGDVGSGKTVVAAMALYDAVLNGYQAVIMVPTEVLAFQHYESLCSLFGNSRVRISLLTRSKFEIFNLHKSISVPLKFENNFKFLNDKMTKKSVTSVINSGCVDIIVGTHALLTDKVSFKSLGLVIVDEQHRFGVEQRATLLRRLTRTDADERGQIEQKESDKNNDFLYEDITYNIRKCLFAVRKKLGLGHKEKIYQNALEEEFKKEGLKFEKEKIININYEGKKIGVYRPDFVIEEKIIIELKALPFIGEREKRQVWTYLKGSFYKLALLVNYSSKDVEIERVVYDIARKKESALSLRQSASVHFLSMTATPIPRSFALTLYGDLDLSIIDEMPADRKPVKTRLVDPHNRQKAYDFIREQVKQGRQVFVVCPLIEDNKDTRIQDTDKLQTLPTGRQVTNYKFDDKKTVLSEYEKLSKLIFPDLSIGFLHGKLKPAEKSETMEQFSSGKTDILVSTSVIEVGVDIPNASVMMIEGAERFGLAQLHQFRGRVGRAEHQSYCFLFTDSDTKKVKKRLEYFEKENSGFKVAEYDLEQRGPGEVYGFAQSGMKNFKLATMQDHDLIKLSRELAREIDFEKYQGLKERVEEWEKIVHLE